jgi:hypothetical protein
VRARTLQSCSFMKTPPWKSLIVGTFLFGAPGCWSCVARGSRVQTPEGMQPIEGLRVGDVVLSYDPLTGEKVAGRITMTRSALRETILLRSADAELFLTSDHPVYCPTERVYAPAGDWALGRRDRLWRLDGAGPVAVGVTGTVLDGGVREVFDITVDTPHHNFCAEGFLVHNKSLAPACEYEGETVYAYDACECPGSETGTIVCNEDGEEASCTCPVLDAGPDGSASSDAGSEPDAS